MRNITGLQPGETTSYTDLWKFTLVNYNAGPGCLGNALNRARNNGEQLDWAHVSQRLEPGCQGAVGYVEDISASRQVLPTPLAGERGRFLHACISIGGRHANLPAHRSGAFAYADADFYRHPLRRTLPQPHHHADPERQSGSLSPDSGDARAAMCTAAIASQMIFNGHKSPPAHQQAMAGGAARILAAAHPSREVAAVDMP